MKTAVSGMDKDVAEVVDAAEEDGVGNLAEILKEDVFVDANSVCQGELRIVQCAGEVHEL